MMGYAERHNQAVNQLRDDLERQRRRITELERQLAAALNGERPADEQLDPDSILVSSMVSAQTKEPLVVLRWFTHYAQLGERAARELAFNILSAVEAAKSDAFIIAFAAERIGLPDERAALLLDDFRAFREKVPDAD
jgi:hypothetical protein